MQKEIPLKYHSQLIQINITGVLGYAWTKELLLEFLNDSLSDDFIILGGDVIVIENGKMKYTYDNWSIDNRQINESFQEYRKRCSDKAECYIKAYPLRANILFIPVFNSEATAGL